jgi:hypothetical protein
LKLRLEILVVFGATLLIGLSDSSPAQSQSPSDSKADLCFAATITARGKSSFAGVPDSANNLSARVEWVIRKPPSVVMNPGDEITILVRDASDFKPGTKALFNSSGWIYGAGIAVRDLGHSIVSQPEEYDKFAGGLKIVEAEQSEAALRDRIANADAVVLGKVSAIGDRIVSCGFGIHGVSEHNPLCKEAFVNVQDALKGPVRNQLVVVFPTSDDVEWTTAPKLIQGQRATFILTKDAALKEFGASTFDALEPIDVLPPDKAPEVRKIALELKNATEKP